MVSLLERRESNRVRKMIEQSKEDDANLIVLLQGKRKQVIELLREMKCIESGRGG